MKIKAINIKRVISGYKFKKSSNVQMPTKLSKEQKEPVKKTLIEKIKDIKEDIKEYFRYKRITRRREYVYVKRGDEWIKERTLPNSCKGFPEDEYLIRRPFRKDKIIDTKTYIENKW